MSHGQPAFQLIEPHDITVIGSSVIDISCTYVRRSDEAHDQRPQQGSSNPAVITQCVGGVAHNIALAAQYLQSSVLLVSVIANDSAGDFLLSEVEKEGLSTQGIMVLKSSREHGQVRTGQHVGNYNHDKELLFGMADVKLMLHPETESEEIWQSLLTKAHPKIIVLDTCFSHTTIDIITKHASGLDATVIVEPVSQPRARDFALSHSFQNIGSTSPRHRVDMLTPNAEEFGTLLEGAVQSGIVEESMLRLSKRLAESASSNLSDIPATVQEKLVNLVGGAALLIRFVPTILITLGSEGVLLVKREMSVCEAGPSSSSGGKISIDLWDEDYRCLFEYFPPVSRLESSKIVSVNGAGDSLVAAVAVELLKLLKESAKEQRHAERDKSVPWSAWRNVIETGQWAALATLQHESAVNPALKDLDGFKSNVPIDNHDH